MFYSLYCQTVESKIPLDSFGVKQEEKASSNNIILDFIQSEDNYTNKFLNHQTQINGDYGYYYIENIALFEVFAGNRIVIKYFNEIDNDLIHTLLNYPFAILFNQRKKYVIHASSISYKDKVFCFCGKSQSGKSSLLSYFLTKGGLLISEDTCVFDYNGNELFLLPSYNFLKISDDIKHYIDLPLSNPIEFKKKSTNRKGYILDDHKFLSKPEIVDYFIYLYWSDKSTKPKELADEESMKLLLSNAFISYSKHNALSNFEAASQLVNQADHFLYKREKKLETLEDFFNTFSKKLI